MSADRLCTCSDCMLPTLKQNPELDPEATVVQEKILDQCIVTDANGAILVNGPQQDIVMRRVMYSDGSYEIIGVTRMERPWTEVVLPRIMPEAEVIPPCKHCGKNPYND